MHMRTRRCKHPHALRKIREPVYEMLKSIGFSVVAAMAVWWHCPEPFMSVPSLAGEAREQIRAVSTIVG